MGRACIKVTIFIVVILVILAVLLGMSFRRLDTYEVGLKYDRVWKSLEENAQTVGLYSGPPGFTFITFPSVFTTLEFKSLMCLNRDGIPITLDVSYQYKARNQHLGKIVELFRDHKTYKEILTAAGESSLLEACSHFNTSQFQSERGKFQESVGIILAERNDQLYCDVSEIQIRNIARPDKYEDAIQEKETAKENIKVSENRRPRLITNAETEKKEAETQAEITVAKAESESRIKLLQAEAMAAAILKQYETEAVTYEKIISNEGLGLSDESFVSYMGIRTISNAKNPVYIGMKSPAKTSYVNP